MAFVETSVRVVHVLFAALWTGGTLFMAGVVLPAAREEKLGTETLEWMNQRFSYVTMASAGILFLTGGHLAGTLYTVETLQSDGRGHLVLTMLLLWVVLAGLLHYGASTLKAQLQDGDSRVAVEKSQPWYRASGIVALLLLVLAGML